MSFHDSEFRRPATPLDKEPDHHCCHEAHRVFGQSRRFAKCKQQSRNDKSNKSHNYRRNPTCRRIPQTSSDEEKSSCDHTGFRPEGRSRNVKPGCAGHHGPYALKVPISREAEDDAELEANQSEQELGILAVMALLLLQFLLLLMSSITIVSVRNYSRFLLLQKI